MENITYNQELHSDFLHGNLWRQKCQAFKEADKIAIPFFLYIDDSEVNNPLGSHVNPITFIYYSFPTITNSEIFLAGAIQGHDYKQYGNEKCLRDLVEDIKLLEENGISIQTSDGEKNVHFVLALFLGDNLGLNTVLGFTSSFNHNYFCRFCKAIKSSTHTLCAENPNLLRNIHNYDEDVAVIDINSTGIKEVSILNEINSFHVTSNFAVCIMHDIFEGVCHYDMCHIITHCIKTGYFSLDTLNIRKGMFNYGEIEIDNLSPSIEIENLNKFHLKMTAREMMSFIHLFSLMVGDLVPEDDHVWLFFLDLLEIIDILLSYEISHASAIRLKFLIERHHKNYTRFFDDTLKPKHHLMLHYYNIILQSGLPRYYWAFRFEAKHREPKAYARNITSRRNICVSIAKKYQLNFANYLFQPEKPTYSVQSQHLMFSEHEEYLHDFCTRNNFSSDKVRCYFECMYLSKKYKRGCFVSQCLDEVCSENALIFRIDEVIVFDECDVVHLICKRINVVKYHKYFASYAVDISGTESQQKFAILRIDDLSGPPINVHKTVRCLNMIRPKQYF